MSFNNFPAKFGKYILLDRLNAGGMAEVFRAKVTGVEGFERLLAIKCMLPSMLEDEHFTGMFVDEARLASQVGHANIVQIYELGREQERLYIAMELINGRDLRNILKTAESKGVALPPQFAAYVASKAAEGLDFAHRKAGTDGKPLGLVHRDVSPQNILVSYDGEVKVVDFGIAKASNEARGTQTQVGVLKGKFAYMAPEQVAGNEIDRRADIFALGSVLFEMIAGKRLFRGESDLTVLERVREGVLPDFNAELPPSAARVVPVLNKALALALDDRFAYASEMAEALEPMLIDEQSIFGSKRAAALMRSLFEHEISQLAEDQKRFAEISEQQCVNLGQVVSAKVDDGARMVFESTFKKPQGQADAAGPADGDGDTGVLVFAPQTPIAPTRTTAQIAASATAQQAGAAPPRMTLRSAPEATATHAQAPSVRPVATPAPKKEARPQPQPQAAKGSSAYFAPAEPTPVVPRRSTVQAKRPTGAKAAAPPRVASARSGETQLLPSQGSSLSRVLKRLRLTLALALLIMAGMVMLVSRYTGAPLSAALHTDPTYSLRLPHWLTTATQQLRHNKWVDEWLFGGPPPDLQHMAPSDFTLPEVGAPGEEAAPPQTEPAAKPAAVTQGYVRISVSGAARAQISIDGKDVGAAPLPPVALSIGSHHIKVTRIFPSGLQQTRETRVHITAAHAADDPALINVSF